MDWWLVCSCNVLEVRKLASLKWPDPSHTSDVVVLSSIGRRLYINQDVMLRMVLMFLPVEPRCLYPSVRPLGPFCILDFVA
jgi:hypothetical protein